MLVESSESTPLTVITGVLFMFLQTLFIIITTAAGVSGHDLQGRDNRPRPGILIEEHFEDTRFEQRGWYDLDDRTTLGNGAAKGRHAIQYHFPKGKLTPSDSSGMRRGFEPTEVVYLRFSIRLSPNWKWTGKPYGPHLLQFMTTENGKYHGPAASRLTLYVEPMNGKLRLASQDIQNKDSPHGLTQGPLRGGYNGAFFDSREVLFDDARWHCVEAMFKLNTLDLAGDKPNPDGEVRGWVDGKLVVERTDVVLRSTDHPRMKINQFLVLPYFHDGVPHDQTLWIDELAVGTSRLGPVEPSDIRSEASTWDGAGRGRRSLRRAVSVPIIEGRPNLGIEPTVGSR